MPTYEQAWTAYEEALSQVYAGAPETAERGAAPLVAGSQLDEHLELLIDRSAELGGTAAAGLSAPERGVRELAQLQLVSAAALDLMTAADLLELDEGASADTAVAERGTSELASAQAELSPILATPQGAGIAALSKAEPERGGAPQDPRAARERLLTEAGDTLDDIVKPTGKAGGAVVRGLLGTPASTLGTAAAAAIHELLGQIGDTITGLIRKAARLVIRAVEKIVTALGNDAESAARGEAKDWVQTLGDGGPLTAVLNWLYESDRIKTEVAAGLEQDTSGAVSFNQRADEINALAGNLAKQTRVLEWVARGLVLVRAPLLALQSWGPLALAAAHLTTLGYTVYLGGDYADWYRVGHLERLDRVAGVRRIACPALGEAAT
jgi:hypothetical protein